ncbi:DUF1566 domain-containing protein [Pseudomonas putida]|uniref:DUF1566 domain-containing protein n=1 Tax=Pseudomonas TaxID=286 RepID=UPI0035264D18
MTTEQIFPPPAIGEAWVGQGGIYAGIVPARNGLEAYHLVIGEDLGRFQWGPYASESSSVSQFDGLLNTTNLIAEGLDYPAAKAAAAYQADDHNDFYLPATAELYEAWLNLGDKDWGLLWSSSQRSADNAFITHFDVGAQYGYGKDFELHVRAVRRIPLQ